MEQLHLFQSNRKRMRFDREGLGAFQEVSRWGECCGAAELSVLLCVDKLEHIDFLRQLLFDDLGAQACAGDCQCGESERE